MYHNAQKYFFTSLLEFLETILSGYYPPKFPTVPPQSYVTITTAIFNGLKSPLVLTAAICPCSKIEFPSRVMDCLGWEFFQKLIFLHLCVFKSWMLLLHPPHSSNLWLSLLLDFFTSTTFMNSSQIIPFLSILHVSFGWHIQWGCVYLCKFKSPGTPDKQISSQSPSQRHCRTGHRLGVWATLTVVLG